MENPKNKEENYLNRVVNASERATKMSQRERAETMSRLNERLTDEPWEKEGVMIFELPGDIEGAPAVCTIEYDSTIAPDLQGHLDRVKREKNPYYPPDPQAEDPNKFRRIKSFLVAGEETLDIKNTCPEYSIYFYQNENNNDKKPDAFVSTKRKYIQSDVDPTTTLGIYVLLHEIGHLESAKNPHSSQEDAMSARTASDLGMAEKLDTKQKAAILREERTASAFALEKMKPFFDAKTMEATRKLGVQAGVKEHAKYISCLDPSPQEKPSWISRIQKLFSKK